MGKASQCSQGKPEVDDEYFEMLQHVDLPATPSQTPFKEEVIVKVLILKEVQDGCFID